MVAGLFAFKVFDIFQDFMRLSTRFALAKWLPALTLL